MLSLRYHPRILLSRYPIFSLSMMMFASRKRTIAPFGRMGYMKVSANSL